MKKEYVAPTLTVVSFVVERGFDASIGAPRNLEFDMSIFDGDQDYNQASSFGDQYWSW